VRAQELFDFEYTLEMYKPEHKRRWGYFALPVLHDDQLVARSTRPPMYAELEDMAWWLDLQGGVDRPT
jgi:uncharacterized protein YcaQ